LKEIDLENYDGNNKSSKKILLVELGSTKP
jgi:hypothetical protein